MVWRVTTHTRRKGGDSFCYRLIFYIIADEQNTHVCSQSFFSSGGVSAFDTSGLRQKIIASPAGRRDLRPGRTQLSINVPLHLQASGRGLECRRKLENVQSKKQNCGNENYALWCMRPFSPSGSCRFQQKQFVSCDRKRAHLKLFAVAGAAFAGCRIFLTARR